MINQNPVFQVNFLKKTLVVRPQEDIAVCVALLDIRKKNKNSFSDPEEAGMACYCVTTR